MLKCDAVPKHSEISIPNSIPRTATAQWRTGHRIAICDLWPFAESRNYFASSTKLVGNYTLFQNKFCSELCRICIAQFKRFSLACQRRGLRSAPDQSMLHIWWIKLDYNIFLQTHISAVNYHTTNVQYLCIYHSRGRNVWALNVALPQALPVTSVPEQTDSTKKQTSFCESRQD
jgi:hypothetical protein